MFPIEKFSENGFAIVEDFLTDSEVDEIKAEISKILKQTETNECDKAVFSVKKRNELYKSDYFIHSNDKMSLFYEDGNDEVNKIGHALHTLNPSIKKLTFSDKIKDVARKFDFEEPVVVQSMYIFKNPKIGGKVRPHQDATYLHTTPSISGLGLWMAMDDATEENGCLQAVVGSHKTGHHNDYQLVRSGGNDEEGRGVEGVGNEVELGPHGGNSLAYKGKEPMYLEDQFVPLVAKKGSLLLIDALLVHFSDDNNSEKPRNAFTLHLFDAKKATWNPLNWLQPSKNGNFVQLYTGQPVY